MKKSLLALAVLSAIAGAASAQSNVTVYGLIDAGIAFDNGSKDAGKIWALQSGQQAGSRLGFKGTEDLGGGLSAIFTLESGFGVDDGAISKSFDGKLFGRQAWVGLQGQFGAVKLGRQYTPLYNAMAAVDPFAVNLAGNAQKIFGAGLYANAPVLQRTDNTISYSTANYSGFTGAVNYGFGEKAGDNNANRNVGVGLSYVNGPLNVQYAYNKANTVDLTTLGGAAANDLTSNFIGATYDFGVAKAHAAFADNKIETAVGSSKDRNWLLGVSAPVGTAGTVMASWARDDVRDVANGKSNLYAIGYSHALSKRTNLYTSFGYVKNDSAKNLAEYGSTGTQTAGASDRLFNVGVRHAF